MNDRSNEALLARRAIAEKAAPGPWAMGGKTSLWVKDSEGTGICTMLTRDSPRNTAIHIAANSPDVVMAHIDEILRLRTEVQRLNKEADYLAGVIAAAYCAQENVMNCEKTEDLPLHKLRDACASCWREAARKAVEETA
ncbi:MAG: hypothetical protein HDQ89_10235 [Desulfovibrio sp.]|nr:hypothetical protein [Desulfovibrio sp.]